MQGELIVSLRALLHDELGKFKADVVYDVRRTVLDCLKCSKDHNGITSEDSIPRPWNRPLPLRPLSQSPHLYKPEHCADDIPCEGVLELGDEPQKDASHVVLSSTTGVVEAEQAPISQQPQKRSGLSKAQSSADVAKAIQLLCTIRAVEEDAEGLLAQWQAIKKWFRVNFAAPPSMEKSKRKQSPMLRFVESSCFRNLSAVGVLVNTVYLGYYAHRSVQYQLQRLYGSDEKSVSWVLPQVLEAYFVLEIILRMAAYRSRFFFGIEWGWNFLDLFVVIGPFVFYVDDWLHATRSSGESKTHRMSGLTVMRSWRVVRLVHTYELFRIPFFAELRMMVNSVVLSFPSLAWTSLLFVLCLYVCTVAILLGVVLKLQSLSPSSNTLGVTSDVSTFWGDLPLSMLSLFQCSTGGMDWNDLWKSIQSLHWGYKLAMVMYICGMSFAILNIISGLFIDRVFRVIRDDRDFGILQEQEARRIYEDRLHGLFVALDLNETSMVTWADFERLLDDPHFCSYFAWLGIELNEEVFNLMDSDRDGVVSVKDFIEGCHECKGIATNLAIKTLQRQLGTHMEALPMRLSGQAK